MKRILRSYKSQQLLSLNGWTSGTYTSKLLRTVMLAFFVPILIALVVISSLDYFSNNDVFSVSAIRTFERGYQSPSISDIALVTFDRHFSHDTAFPETRKDILELANVLVENGAKLVVLDYLFDYSAEVFPISKALKNKIVVGSQIVYRGNRAIELAPPQNLFPSEILRYNWGTLSFFDTQDRYGAINSLVYYQTVNHERLPSLSLAAFHRSHNAGNNTELRRSGVGIPDKLISNGRYWLVVPNNLSELDNRTYSAWDLAFKLENNLIDVNDKTVFVATTWDINQDHFYIGSQSTGSFFDRVLIWSGLSKEASYDGKLPGVYAHISAYLNLVDGHYYLHPSSEVGLSYSLTIAYIFYISICIVLLAVYGKVIFSFLLKGRHRQLFIYASALATGGSFIFLSYLYASIVFSEYQLSLSLTLPLWVAIFILLLITAKVLDSDKENDREDSFRGFSYHSISVPTISYSGWKCQGNKGLDSRSYRGGNSVNAQSNHTEANQDGKHDL